MSEDSGKSLEALGLAVLFRGAAELAHIFYRTQTDLGAQAA
jgi:hypothetical protein